ncbi:hypothetical protein MBLNU230_g2811t1 [Neophaeotheca triangularis]
MPFRQAHPLLRLDCPALTGIDTSSTEDLYSMWSLFSKTSHAMEDGKRLENLSWRLWTRETFCCEPKTQARSMPRRASTNAAMATDIPALSSSLSSATSDETDNEETSSPAACLFDHSRPALKRHDSTTSRSRGFEKHITPIDLEKIVISIKETKDLESIDLPMATPSSKATAPQVDSDSASQKLSQLSLAASDSPVKPADTFAPNQQAVKIDSSASTIDTNDTSKDSQTVGSQDSSSTEMSNTHSVVRGFVPGGAPSSYRSQTHLASAQPTPILKTSPTYHPGNMKKKGPMFTIGTSSGEEESSLESRYKKGNSVASAKSSLSESIRKQDQASKPKKMASFKLDASEGRAAQHSAVFESDDEDDEVSESAIDDDDDSSDWEDSDEASGPSSVNEKELFHRVDSRPNLTSRKSLLTSMMHEPDRAKALQNAASRSTPALRRSRTSSPNGPSVAASPQPGAANLQVPEQEPQRSQPIIMTTSNTHPTQLSLSPRTTRRNMLSTELTESLRKNLLWERQHKSSGNLAAMKRRHTSTDVKNLRQHPEPAPPVLSQQGSGAKTYTNDFFNAGLQEYHTKGW